MYSVINTQIINSGGSDRRKMMLVLQQFVTISLFLRSSAGETFAVQYQAGV